MKEILYAVVGSAIFMSTSHNSHNMFILSKDHSTLLVQH